MIALWGVKASLVSIRSRMCCGGLTFGVSLQGAFLCMYTDISNAGRLPTYVPRLIKTTAALCISTFLGVLLVATLWCRPLYKNWLVHSLSINPGTL